MILQNVDALSEKNRQNVVCPLISFKTIKGHLTKCKGDVFYRRLTYVVWPSFQKIGAETTEKECLEKIKKLDTKYNGSSLLHTRRP